MMTSRKNKLIIIIIITIIRRGKILKADSEREIMK